MALNDNVLQATLEALKAAQSLPNSELAKASTFPQPANATTGINFYDLELGAKLLYPVLTPLRNEIPRVSGKGGTQANWRAITAINTTNMRAGVSSGNRGGQIVIATADYTAAYKGFGLEDNVDFEADYAAMGFDDAKALAAKVLLEAVMLMEELTILGGCNSVPIGTTPTPSVGTSVSGGTLAAQTWSIICVALGFMGMAFSTVAGGVTGQVTRTNVDASTDTFGGGAAIQSAAASQVTTGAASTITASVALTSAPKGAVGYAWYWGLAGAEKLGAITNINSVLITAAATGTQLASAISGPATDSSTCSLDFDGLFTQAFKSGSNAYIAIQPSGTAGTGTPLTADGEGGIVEIDTALKSLWDNYRLSPDEILVSSQEQKNISAKILSGTSVAAQRFVFTVDQSQIGGGVMVVSYRNKYSLAGAKEIPIKLHPNMPPGTVLILTKTLPYPLSNVRNVIQIKARKEYYQIEWPLVSRKYQYGVYYDEVLQHYFPPSMAVITNIANG